MSTQVKMKRYLAHQQPNFDISQMLGRSVTASIFSPTSSDLHFHCNNKFKLSIKYYLHMGIHEH